MIITPTEHDTLNESSGPAELLIKEAQQKARRRRPTKGIVLLGALLVVVVLLVVVGGGRTSPKKATTGDLAKTVTSVSPTCLRSQLHVAFVGANGGLGHAGNLIQVTNVSGNVCSLTGYPRVTGVFASGVQRIFKDTLNGYLGGLFFPSSRAKLPVATLRARHGVASSMEESVLRLTCPGFTSYVVSLPHVTGGTYTFHNSFPDRYCFQPEVHPFVPGSTGSAK
jgi:hypothetical protein